MALAGINTTLPERLCMIVAHEISKTRRWTELEGLTGIPATSWQKAITGKQRPTAEMIEAIAAQWPLYAFWLSTGHTDINNGHIAPGNTTAPEIERSVVALLHTKKAP